MAVDNGSCKNYSQKWFFDIDQGACSEFWYHGCEGNGNRFDTEIECKNLCVEPSGRGAFIFFLTIMAILNFTSKKRELKYITQKCVGALI